MPVRVRPQAPNDYNIIDKICDSEGSVTKITVLWYCNLPEDNGYHLTFRKFKYNTSCVENENDCFFKILWLYLEKFMYELKKENLQILLPYSEILLF